MHSFQPFIRLAAVAGLLFAAGAASADIKVDVKQDATTKMWRYAYTIQHDDAIRAMGPGDIEEIELETKDVMGVDVPLMTLLPKAWSVNWEIDEDDDIPLVVWGILEDGADLKPGGPPATFVLYSVRAPGDAEMVLYDEGGNKAKFTVQGPTGE